MSVEYIANVGAIMQRKKGIFFTNGRLFFVQLFLVFSYCAKRSSNSSGRNFVSVVYSSNSLGVHSFHINRRSIKTYSDRNRQYLLRTKLERIHLFFFFSTAFLFFNHHCRACQAVKDSISCHKRTLS